MVADALLAVAVIVIAATSIPGAHPARWAVLALGVLALVSALAGWPAR